jgi:hypothetical protein
MLNAFVAIHRDEGDSMRKHHIEHWQDVGSLLIGLWLIASPWVLGIDIHAAIAAVGTSVVIGIALVACAVTEFFIPESWEEYSELYLGAWLVASPWIQEYQTVAVARTNVMVCGIAVLVLAVWVLASDRQFGWLRGRITH